MAGVQDSALAIATHRAGALGSLPAALMAPDQLAGQLRLLSAACGGAFNVNFFAHVPPAPDVVAQARWIDALRPYYREFGLDPENIQSGPGRAPFTHEIADLVEPFRPSVVSFHFGLPARDLLARVKSWGCQIWSSATTVDEARWLAAQGVNAVIAQGLEAGGHRGHFLDEDLTRQMGTFALLPQIVRAVQVPVIAAGGIATAEGVRAARSMGAAAVQAGTVFLLCDECTTSRLHRDALQGEAAQHTALTNLFTGRPARGILNRLMREAGPLSSAAPPFPLATAALAPLRAAAEARGSADFTPLWSGQNASACRAVPAADQVRELVRLL